jgi:hypothetical protein
MRANQARKTRPAWEFMWTRLTDTGKEQWKSRTYRAKSIEEACDKMLKFIRGRDGDIFVDYEARAEHVRYRSDRHEEKFPNLSDVSHPISTYVW